MILLVLLLLFGADKAPQLARTIGQARAKLDQARGQFTEAIKSEEERAWDEQLQFERERERKVLEALDEPAGTSAPQAASADPDHQALVRAAEELGLQTQGLNDNELKAAIRARMGGAPAREKSSEKAADARQ